MLNENEKTNGIKRNSRNNNFSKQAQRVFLYCENDVDRSELIKDILSHDAGMDCVVSYAETYEKNVIQGELSETGLFVLWVTVELLEYIRNNGFPIEYQIAKELHVPILPIAKHTGLFPAFTEVAGAIHGIAKSENEYRDKLKMQLENFLLSDEIIKRIDEKAFNGNVFLSYRKMDYENARKFMKIFHDTKEFQGVSVWYDNFLTAGRVFDDEIRESMEKADIFTLLVTPNLMLKNNEGNDNYVMAVEYPFAVTRNKTIISVEAQATNKDEFNKIFKNETTVDINNTDALKQAFKKLQADTYDCERLYLLGVAYLKGYKVERDTERAVKLLEQATEYECAQALEATELLAKSYTDGTLERNFQKALPWREKVVTLCEKIYGVESMPTATAYREAWDCNYRLISSPETLVFLDKERIIREKLLGTTVHEEIARTYFNMGRVYMGMDNRPKALDCFIIAQNILEKLEATNSSLFAEIHANIGYVQIDIPDYTKSLEYNKKSLTILKKTVGEEHEQTLYSIIVIARCYCELNDMPKAIAYLTDALAICKKVYGEHYFQTAELYFGLGECYHKLVELPKALEFYIASLLIREKIFDMEHTQISSSYDAIGGVYSQMNNFTKAFEYCNKGLSIREKVHGTKHRYTAYSYSSIGWLYYNMSDWERAVEFHGKAVTIRDKALGAENIETAASYDALGYAYNASGDTTKALEYFHKSLTAREKILGEQHPDTIKTSESIGWAYHNTNDFHHAIKFHGKALAAREKTLGTEHAETADSYEAMGYAYNASGNPAKALEYFNKSLTAREKTLGAQHPDTIKTSEFITNVLLPAIKANTN